MNRSERHWKHWRWLCCLPHAKYLRALAVWRILYDKQPQGVVIDCHGCRLNLFEER